MWQGVVVVFSFSFFWEAEERKKTCFFTSVNCWKSWVIVSTVLSISPSKFTIPNKKILFATLQASVFFKPGYAVYMVNLRIKGTQTMQVLDSVDSMTWNAWRNVRNISKGNLGYTWEGTLAGVPQILPHIAKVPKGTLPRVPNFSLWTFSPKCYLVIYSN